MGGRGPAVERSGSRHPGRAQGGGGAAATAHPLATSSALDALAAGGSAVDAAIAAQAVLCVTSPQACGLGGDVMAVIRPSAGAEVAAVSGTGRSATSHPGVLIADGGPSATVPGIVDGWAQMHRHWGRRPWADLFSPAIELAEAGRVADPALLDSLAVHRARLERGGAAGWSLLAAPDRWSQPELADLLRRIATDGPVAFYGGAAARAIAAAVVRDGGGLTADDVGRHRTLVGQPLSIRFGAASVYIQPPPSQGVLLALALRALEQDLAPDIQALLTTAARDHVLVEIIQDAFASRDDAHEPAAVLRRHLSVDPDHAGHRGGPRAYLHTAGVAVADPDGMVVSSLVSVFDDFGSATFVPELGIVLNNRAAGFTTGANAPRSRAYPVHTLAPIIVTDDSDAFALATPGADGQVQTLLQLLAARRWSDVDVDAAIDAPRWRSEGDGLLVEATHPAAGDLRARGHRVQLIPAGDDRFGAVVAAGAGRDAPWAVADHRRQVSAGALDVDERG